MQGRRGRRYVMAMAGIVLALLVLLWLLLPNTPFRPVSWQIKGLVGFEDASLSDETTPVELVTPSGLAGTGSPSGDQAAGPGYFVWRPGAWVYIEEQEVPPPPMAATTLPDVIPLFSPIGWVMAALQPVFPGASDRASVPPTLAFVVSVTLEPGSNLLPSPNANEALSPQLEMTQVFDGADVSAAPRSDANPQLPQPATPEAEQTHPPTRGSAPTETALPARAGSPAQGAASTPNPTTPLSQDPTENPNDGNTISQSPGEPHLPSHNNVPERVKIRIDKSEYALTIHFDGEPVAKFPVGLGRNDATPEGNFVIANKVTNPDWSDRGRIVKAGDPETPLGKRWMGLGTDGRTTSYGIHPTNEPESIGANMSRGCIRMRPEDAETVFRLCPSGTAVYIEP
jgi:lipoprotein-anchoring transpeptidase ErfK/SrfK